MNKNILVLAVTALWIINARAALLLNDDFNSYPDGSLVGAPGSPWIHASGATPGQVNVTSGRVSVTSSETEDVGAFLSGNPISPGSGTLLYTSFTVSFSALPTAGGAYFAHFRDNTNSNFRDTIWASTTGAGAGSFRLGIGNTTAATAISGQIPTDLSLNTSYTVVTRYDVDAAQSMIWLNPAAESDPSVAATDSSTPFNIYAFNLRQNAGEGTMTIDDLKVGNTFADVVPEPSTLALLGLGALGLLSRRFRRRTFLT
ncbi:MAG: hypothetical protein DME18_12110 [Verrucomicrobia bacterium]|nr:MAG: hypothetical protein DME18_12110 [Verrucomicrobiota bacterium]